MKPITLKKEAKILLEPTGNLHTTNLSISAMMTQEKDIRKQQQKDLLEEPFTKEDVIRWWKTNAHQQKTNDQEQLSVIMLKRELIQQTDTLFHFEVENKIQQTRLESKLYEIVNYIREKVKNHLLSIQTITSSDSTEETKHLTGKEKFEKLAKKNSNLFDLKNRFNLDIDY